MKLEMFGPVRFVFAYKYAMLCCFCSQIIVSTIGFKHWKKAGSDL